MSDSFETAYNSLRTDFLEAYPDVDFVGFKKDQRYMDERRDKDELIRIYKQEIVPKMESGDWESAGAVLDKVLNDSGARKMKLYSWDYGLLSDYLSITDGQANFARKVANLTDERENLKGRIEQFLDFILSEGRLSGYTKSGERRKLTPPATCSMVSSLLTLNDPGKYFFCKDRLIKRTIQRFDPKFSWNEQHIQAREIQYVNDLAGRVSERLSAEGWEPKDMLDVQSFFWKADEMAQSKLKDGKPSPPPREVHSKIDITTSSPREVNSKIDAVKNLILFGPPGTGKTWQTVDKALKILDPEFYEDHKSDRTALKRRFDELREEERIGFVTFHQSFSYEDFVEGLRASTQEGQISYEIEDGIFKRMCGDVKVQDKKIWKMLLGRENERELYIHCIESDQILLGKGGGINFEGARTREEVDDRIEKSGQNFDGAKDGSMVNSFVNEMQVGDLVLVADGNYAFRAIGEIIGGYKWVGDSGYGDYCQSRKVKWYRVYEPSRPTSELGKNFMMWALYQLDGINRDSLQSLLDEPRVLIIDEINRGNIANIFGELITLIEPSKRAGAEEALEVTLPYSKEPFSVPANLYIVGTMNTADRSLVHIDTALRRRFEFEAMLPDTDLLQGIDIDGIDIQNMLTTINSRIELLYDREHTLGHSFFLSLKENPDLGTLKRIFKNSIMPLLEEYFFEDWSRIRKVLGDDRKSRKELQLMFYVQAFNDDEIKNLLGEGDENNQGLSDKVFRRNEQALDEPDAYIGIYEEPAGQVE